MSNKHRASTAPEREYARPQTVRQRLARAADMVRRIVEKAEGLGAESGTWVTRGSGKVNSHRNKVPLATYHN